MGNVHWDDGPRVRAHTYWVHNVVNGQRDFYRLLDKPQCVWLHWVTETNLLPKGRHLPCFGARCPHCPRTKKLHAYCAAQRWVRSSQAPTKKGEPGGEWQTLILHLPENAWESLFESLCRIHTADEIPWRGMIIEVSVVGIRHKVQVLEKELKVQMPDPFDVRPSLMRLWGITEKYVSQRGLEPGILPFKQKGA